MRKGIDYKFFKTFDFGCWYLFIHFMSQKHHNLPFVRPRSTLRPPILGTTTALWGFIIEIPVVFNWLTGFTTFFSLIGFTYYFTFIFSYLCTSLTLYFLLYLSIYFLLYI